MSTHFKWYPGSDDVVVPWNARYSFPSQANKTVKLTPRIPPKNGATFSPGNVIRLEFPAQGYVNPANTTLSFDVTLIPGSGTAREVRFQNNIQSIFSRVRLLYGSTPIEDIVNYNMVVRALTEWSSSNPHVVDQSAVSEGIGGCSFGSGMSAVGSLQTAATIVPQGLVNIRQNYIQGECQIGGPATAVNLKAAGSGSVNLTRKYQISFALGMFTQEKLIPTKFMASQLAIEITLETAPGCIIQRTDSNDDTPSYTVSNVNLIPEILEFDASYDSMFLMGLQQGGVPIKFSSWHTYIFATGGNSRLNLQIQERSRSVKALFAIQRRAPNVYWADSGAMHFVTRDGYGATSSGTATGGLVSTGSSNGSTKPSTPGAITSLLPASLNDFQFRIGGRYYPAAPVQCSQTSASAQPNGGAEALLELQKALNQVGDYRLSTAINPKTFGVGLCYNGTAAAGAIQGTYNQGYLEHDFNSSLVAVKDGFAFMSGVTSYNASTATSYAPAGGNAFCGNTGSANFAMAVDLETSNGVEISGLNAEEQVGFLLILV